MPNAIVRDCPADLWIQRSAAAERSGFKPSATGRSTWLECVAIAGLVAIAGCGTADYEELVKARIQELKTATPENPINWSTANSSFGYTFQWPGPPTIESENSGQVMLEKLSLNAGGYNFQANFLQSANLDKRVLADTQVQQMQGQGFVTERQGEGTLDQVTYIDLIFRNDETQTRNRTRVLQLSSGSCCVLSATGKSPDGPELNVLFDSVRLSQ